jgi:hypothetical protein
MFRIINFLALIRYVAALTTVISILAYELLRSYWDKDFPLFKVISIAPWVSFAILLLICTNFTARFIWRTVKKIDKSLYPDLNGTWEGEIVTEQGKIIPAKALIKQTLLQTWIDLHTDTSKSQTLETTPAIESGQCKLYYTYRSNPKNPDWSPYVGMTIFDIRFASQNSESPLELSGYYFTDRKSKGRVSLRQVSKDVSADISFY